MKRLLLGIAAMIGVQIGFGLASEAIPTASLAALAALVIAGLFVAATCGALVSRRGFVFPSVAVVAIDLVLCVYVLANDPTGPNSYPAIFRSTWPLILGALAAVVLGAKFGQWFSNLRSHPTAAS